jgi:GTP cyclohydrolase II
VLWVKLQSENYGLSLEICPDFLLRYLVYNLRKRAGDSADKYFKSTELIAGVKDMRFQALMPDVLHWLGIKKIDNMISMSDMFVTIFFLKKIAKSIKYLSS